MDTRVAHSPLFDGVDPDLVSLLVAGGEVRVLRTGERLLRAGATNSTLFVILAGQLSVRVTEAPHALLRFGPGDCVGELSVLDGQQVSTDVVADGRVEVLGFDRDQVWTLIERSPVAARNLLRVLAGRIRRNGIQLADASRRWMALAQIATVDDLTGLRNRRWMEDAFTRCLGRAHHGDAPLALLMLDVDHFKQVNDRYGHQVGDETLRIVAQTLAHGVRPHDLLARYGGEEFAALLPNAALSDAVTAAERLRALVEDTTRHTPVPVTISIGVTSLRPADSLATLVARADEALYEAKRAGRNRVYASDRDAIDCPRALS